MCKKNLTQQRLEVSKTYLKKTTTLLVFTLSTSSENKTFTDINESAGLAEDVSHILQFQECTASAGLTGWFKLKTNIQEHIFCEFFSASK